MIDSTSPQPLRADHGGNLDTACLSYGGTRDAWIDLSTGINPVPFPLPSLSASAWTNLPDTAASDALIAAARQFWKVPDGLDILPTHGASASIAALPHVLSGTSAAVPGPTYNEHARAFQAAGWVVTSDAEQADVHVIVHPNNPDGRLWSERDIGSAQLVIDESFADCGTSGSLLPFIDGTRHVVLKSFGKFWGLAGLRLGFVIGGPQVIEKLRLHLGPWSVSGPALEIGRHALRDNDWARDTRTRLAEDAQRLDALAMQRGLTVLGGTSLFRLYECARAATEQEHLAQHKIWSRTFPYSQTWLRLGLPAPRAWDRVTKALAT